MSPSSAQQLAPLTHPLFDLFLLGFIVACSLVAALFFLRFWKSTRDPLFIAFSAFFGIQAVNYAMLLAVEHPNEGNFLHSIIRLLAVIGLLAAMVWKNFFES
jgi:amino acid permease